MTSSDRDRRHRWAETCDLYAARAEAFARRNNSASATIEAIDLRAIAAYLRADEMERHRVVGVLPPGSI